MTVAPLALLALHTVLQRRAILRVRHFHRGAIFSPWAGTPFLSGWRWR
ncbi:hypothetical protein M1755_25150 [Salmonella enterica subsp. enterica serovar Weltevreden]|nr:hypothetical protein [Salmonella enterica]MCT7135531.1 hypothetical protein [Salmonella enterica subsp. enterica serovar Weltevreden]